MKLNFLLPHVPFYVLLYCHFGLPRDIDPEFVLRVYCFSLLVYSRLDYESIAQNFSLLLQNQGINAYSLRFLALVNNIFKFSDIVGDETLNQSVSGVKYFLESGPLTISRLLLSSFANCVFLKSLDFIRLKEWHIFLVSFIILIG